MSFSAIAHTSRPLLVLMMGVFLVLATGVSFGQDPAGAEIDRLNQRIAALDHESALEAARQGNHQEAIRLLVKALQATPASVQYWKELSREYQLTGDIRRARIACETAIEILERQGPSRPASGPSAIAPTRQQPRTTRTTSATPQRPPTPTEEVAAWARNVRLTDPLPARGEGLFYPTVLIPEMTSGQTVGKGRLIANVRLGWAESKFSNSQGGYDLNFDAEWQQGSVGLLYGVSERFDLGINVYGRRIVSYENDVAIIGDSGPLIAERTVGFSPAHAILSAKLGLLDDGQRNTPKLAANAALKCPLGGDDDFVDSGGFDGAVFFSGTFPIGDADLHANLGYTFLGNQELIEDVDFNGGAFGGLALGYPLTKSLGLITQFQWNQNLFGDIEAIDADQMTGMIGLRLLQGNFGFTLGAGSGLNDGSGDFQGLFEIELGIQ